LTSAAGESAAARTTDQELTANMPHTPESAIGNLADLGEGQIALSRFIVQHDGGLYVILSRLESPTDIPDFVNRVITSGLYFRGLDYARFLSLLFGQPAAVGKDSAEEVFLAADITFFGPERQTLYKDLLIEGDQADYLFEPLYVEAQAGQAIDESADRGHRLPPTSGKLLPGENRRYLDADEFIANAWKRGVRYGIDLAAVLEGIELDRAERRVVARGRPFVPGKDAEIVELAPGLHRNNAPRRLLGGRLDLRQFETRYPQVAAGLRLVKKTPRTAGEDGCNIAGQLLPAPLPKDFNLESLAGPGTRVSREADGEYLLATVSGFLNIDRQSNQFSVTDKIVSHEGVSVRTTGDLLLTGDVYEQHGEIQEKRIVQCRSITAYADVYGNIVSAGGIVRLKRNLVGGSASNEDGDIIIEGMASGAQLTALGGCVTIKRADNCAILARQVVLGQATNCDIVAEQLTIEVSEACAMAARTIQVACARARRELDSVLLLLLPDLAPYETQLASLRGKLAALEKTIVGHRVRADLLRSDKEVSNYLSLATRLRNHEATLTVEQTVSWHRLAALVAPALRSLAHLTELIKELTTESAALAMQVEAVLAAREQVCSDITCKIDRVESDTRVSALLMKASETPLNALPNKELKARLRRTDPRTKLLFAGSSGPFEWSYRNRLG
jgi:hypothetical protein